MAEKVFLNDAIVDADLARIHPTDAGLLHGIGLFETIRVYWGRPFRLENHLARLLASAQALSLPLRHTAANVQDAVTAAIRANSLANGRLRITVTRGPIRPGAAADAPPESTLLVTVGHEAGYPAALYETGMAVATASTCVNPIDLTAGHKTLNYWPRLLTLQAARAQHCGEALWFTPDDLLAEACVSNVFVVADGRLATPPVSTPVLPGITRAAVRELAATGEIEIEERPIPRAELLEAGEVFLTNSIMEVMPVVLIDRKPVGDGKPGPLTRAMIRLYRGLVEEEVGS